MAEGVIAVNVEGAILFANDRAGSFLDFQPAGAVSRKLWEVIRNPSLHEMVHHAQARGEPVSQEITSSARQGKVLSVQAVPLSGSPERGVVLVFHDTSEMRRLERLRQDFAANVSHELKTPLAVIKACVETLLDGALDDAQNRRSFVQQVSEQADRLHALILDLLTLSRIESGTEAFAFQPVSLSKAVADCVEQSQPRAIGKGQELLAAVDGQDVVAWADQEAVHEILQNLIDNALKYTPSGGRITVGCRQEDGQCTLEVADTGIGIGETDLSRVFERFYRVDKARSRELGGTGLGLSIVKHLASAMKGGVEARSRPGHGSTFIVRLPKAAG
jgi:two-component system phosphate regulon sensor histidine kinase PhoR